LTILVKIYPTLLVKLWNYLVTTYEGHSWERLCFALAKEAKPLVKCIAYQHAPIFKYQHAKIFFSKALKTALCFFNITISI
jgi:hypothetical protein